MDGAACAERLESLLTVNRQVTKYRLDDAASFFENASVLTKRQPAHDWVPDCLANVDRRQMKPSAKDQIAGKLHEVRGRVKQKAGEVTNNPDLAAEGEGEKLAGTVQKKIGQIEKVFEK
ncbi:MAG: hypothetical protein JWO19_3171 [Bryobacterales bacterium]|nr:hypothetical protein [Bryobacterales bacterium]